MYIPDDMISVISSFLSNCSQLRLINSDFNRVLLRDKRIILRHLSPKKCRRFLPNGNLHGFQVSLSHEEPNEYNVIQIDKYVDGIHGGKKVYKFYEQFHIMPFDSCQMTKNKLELRLIFEGQSNYFAWPTIEKMWNQAGKKLMIKYNNYTNEEMPVADVM